MSTTRKLVPRASGEYRDGSPWTRNFRGSIAALKASATEVSGTLTVTPSRTTACQNAHIRFNAVTTMSVSDTRYEEVLILFDFGDDGAVFDMIDAHPYMDILGRSAELGFGQFCSHVWESVGTKNVTCFAYHEASNTWEEVTTTVSIVDPLTVHPASKRYIVAVDGDFTGAPAAGNTYTSHLEAIQAMAAADAGGLLLTKRGTTDTIEGISGGPQFREVGTEWHIDAWGEGAKPKIICNFGGEPFGTFANLFTLLEMESFTLANMHYTGLYNSSVDPQNIEGEVVAGGFIGGAASGGTGGRSTDVQVVYAGFGSSQATQVQTNNVTLYGCHIARVGKAFYSAGGDYHAIINCNVSEWADYGTFHTYSKNFSFLGTQGRVRSDCVHLGGGKDYTALPRQVLHGPHRTARSIGEQVQGNSLYTKNGWFSATSCQPPIRLNTDGALYPADPVTLTCSRNLAQGGDGSIFFTPANPGIECAFTESALIESNITEGDQFTYEGNVIAQAAIVRNNITIQPQVTSVGPNDVWRDWGFMMYGGDDNGTDPNVFLQPAKAYSNTLVNYMSVESIGAPWVPFDNALDVSTRETLAYPNAVIEGNLDYAPNLAGTIYNKVDPQFDSSFVPQTPTFTDSYTRPVGSILDIHGNIRPSITNAGAAQGDHSE